MYPLRYLPHGHVFIDPEDDCDRVVDALLQTNYPEEFCLARDFDEDFICSLMEAGFLVMSTEIPQEDTSENGCNEGMYILLPKLHLVRSVMFFPDLHIKKSIRKFLPNYELRVDVDFDIILSKCIKTHGSDWLTPPLVNVLQSLRHRRYIRPKLVSFGVYREGELKAGEFGVVMGRVYTSYSGYYEESNAGTVQMILMAQWLKKTGFDFLDFGMPLDYKTSLGSHDINPRCFVKMFRSARY